MLDDARRYLVKRSRPPYDPAIAPVIDMLQQRSMPRISLDTIVDHRISAAAYAEDLELFGLDRAEWEATAEDGTALAVTTFRPRALPIGAPCLLYFHGGGMVLGDRFTGLAQKLGWADRLRCVVATVEYRLAPEFPDPIPVEDCFRAYIWVREHAASIGIDAERLVLIGSSAGAGLAAGVALLARDQGAPAPAGALLEAPMLDDRNDSVSAHQFHSVGLWDSLSNDVGWGALLGERAGTADVSPYAAPARATDLSGLPPFFLDVGSAEVFRDEVVALAARMWSDGADAELHVWPGGSHGFDLMAPSSGIGTGAVEARLRWLHEHLGHSR
jgi:acetyl esterase/lipase